MGKRILRNYSLINLVLIAVIVFLALEFYRVYSQKMDVPLEAIAGQAREEAAETGNEAKPVDPSPFQVITNMDIFRPSRSPYKEEAAQPLIPKIPPRLFGTIILGAEKTAILEDPNSRSTRLYRVNDPVGGYVVSDILEDRVILLLNGEKSEVRLREEKKGLQPLRPMVIPPAQPQQQQPAQQQARPGQRPAPQRPVPQRSVPQSAEPQGPDRTEGN